MSNEQAATPEAKPGRRGREARTVARQTKVAGRVVQPGMLGGRYKPLADADMKRIYDTALDVLENIGIGESNHEKLLHYALPAGCTLKGDRLLFPRALVEDMLDKNAKSFMAYGVNPKYDLEIRPEHVHTGTSGEAVTILEYETQHYRPSTLVDLYDAGRLVDQLEHIHAFGQPFIASEWSEDLFTHDTNTAYSALSATQKTFSLGVQVDKHVDHLIGLFDTFLGREGAFLERPFCAFGGCPIVSPLRWGTENMEVMLRNAELGLTSDIVTAAQAGATAPAALAGALVQTFAEMIACVTIVNIIKPGSKVNFGMWPFISDLRTGAFSGGSGEEALVTACVAQICNYFGIIASVPSGMTDSKTVDAQYGYEKAITTTMAALAGGAFVSPYPGIVGSLLGQSFEGLIIDNDMIGSILRCVRGVEVNDETLSYDVIKSTVFGAGHFLNQDQTLNIMLTEYIYPDIADRRTAGLWENTGKEDIYELAHHRVKKMLSNYYPEYIDPKVDAKIRERYPIKLRPEDKRPGNGRWE
jgi:trimethylamine--corrinoid protein Co-methyltransferase